MADAKVSQLKDLLDIEKHLRDRLAEMHPEFRAALDNLNAVQRDIRLLQAEIVQRELDRLNENMKGL